MEAGLGAARAVTTTAPAKGIGKSINGISGALDKALKPAQSSATTATPKLAPDASIVAVTTPVVSARSWEDPAAIESGLDYEDLVRRFGTPVMSISNTDGKSLTYRGKEGYYQVETKDGAVASIAKPQA